MLTQVRQLSILTLRHGDGGETSPRAKVARCRNRGARIEQDSRGPNDTRPMRHGGSVGNRERSSEIGNWPGAEGAWTEKRAESKAAAHKRTGATVRVSRPTNPHGYDVKSGP